MTKTCEHQDGYHWQASRYLYVPADDRKIPVPGYKWSKFCPDDVDPRSEENPLTFTYAETVAGEKRETIEERYPSWEDTWIRVGVIDGYDWIHVDVDEDPAEHDLVIDDPAKIEVDGSVAETDTTGGTHYEVLAPEGTQVRGRRVEGIDYQGTIDGMLGVAGDPFHTSDGYEFVSAGEPIDGPPGEAITYEGDPLLVPREVESADTATEAAEMVEEFEPRTDLEKVPFWDIYDDPELHPGNQPHPKHGSSSGGNFLVDDHGHSGFCFRDGHECFYTTPMLLAVHWGFIDCGEWSTRGDFPDEVREKVYRKAADEGLIDSIPEWVTGGPFELPELRGRDRNEQFAEIVRNRTHQRVRDVLSSPLDGCVELFAPLGSHKTESSVEGADDHPRLINTRNKDEHRDSARYFADKHDVSVEEVIPFADSWLVSDESPVQEEVMRLYQSGFKARELHARYGDLIPDDAETPYLDQYDDEITADVLLGSPGHEGISHFREFTSDGGETVRREIIYDDTHPVLEQLVENSFTIDEDDEYRDSARPELNALLRELDRVESNCVEDLLRSPEDRLTIQNTRARNYDGDRGANEIPLIDIAARKSLVQADTLRKLRIVCGSTGERGIEPFRTSTGWYTYVRSPEIQAYDIAILSGTPVPHLTEAFFEHLHDGAPDRDYEYVETTSNPEAYWKARGLEVIQTSRNQHARSGGNINAERTKHLVDTIERNEGVRPPVIDAKKAHEQTGEDGVNFARAPSNNELRDEHVGLVSGPTYYGDEYVEIMAAYCGVDEDIEHPSGGRATATTDVGSDLLTWMKQSSVAQGIGRFGRDDEPTHVYVDTDEIPEQFPTIDLSDQVTPVTETQKKVADLAHEGYETAKEIAEHVDIGVRQVRNVMRDIATWEHAELEEFATEDGAHRIDVDDEPFGNPGLRISMEKFPNGLESFGLDDLPAPDRADAGDASPVTSAASGLDPPD